MCAAALEESGCRLAVNKCDTGRYAPIAIRPAPVAATNRFEEKKRKAASIPNPPSSKQQGAMKNISRLKPNGYPFKEAATIESKNGVTSRIARSRRPVRHAAKSPNGAMRQK